MHPAAPELEDADQLVRHDANHHRPEPRGAVGIAGVRREHEPVAPLGRDELEGPRPGRHVARLPRPRRGQDAEPGRVEKWREGFREAHHDGGRVRRLDRGQRGECCTLWRRECGVSHRVVRRLDVGGRDRRAIRKAEIRP